MKYYINLFSPETHGAFTKSDQTTSGFSIKQQTSAKKIKPGDRFICYVTKISRFAGIFEVVSDSFVDDTPIFYEQDDPFILRFKVKPLVWLQLEESVPMFNEIIWDHLSITGESKSWMGMIRGSLQHINTQDAKYIEEILLAQKSSPKDYPLSESDLKKLKSHRIKTHKQKSITVSIPESDDNDTIEEPTEVSTVRDSIKVQAILAEIGERMKMKIWIPRADRNAVLEVWKPKEGTLLETLPMNYDDTTLKTIENIDVLWIKRSSIVRAFEVEHTTSIYSGLLRMADLMALQPNLEIQAHIVAPAERKYKVFQEITRPVFSLLEKGPLAETCTYLSYDAALELQAEKRLEYMTDSVLDEFTEEAEA